MVISDQRNVGGTDLISTFTVATERLLPSRHMGSLITSDFSCKSTLRVEEWKMKFEDNNCVSSFKVRQFMGVSTGSANAGVSPSMVSINGLQFQELYGSPFKVC